MPIFLDLSGEIVAEDAIPITQKVTWRRLPWERVAELLGRPLRSGMSRNTEMDDPASVMSQHQEYIKDLEAKRRYREEIHRYQALHVIL
jgi:hypothetical protein